MKVTFARAYDYRVPGKPTVVSYSEGWAGTVPKAHGEAAQAAGALKEADDGEGA